MPRILAGALAGTMAGIVFGVLMQMMNAPTPEGGSMPMMAMVAMVVGSKSIVVGWLYHLFNSAFIGALFALALGGRIHSTASGLLLGAVYGLAWWVLGALVLMPLMLGMPAFAPIRMPMMQPVALGSLMGHLLYGLILGVGFVKLHHPSPGAVARGVQGAARIG
jgi:hypothetical protein